MVCPFFLPYFVGVGKEAKEMIAAGWGIVWLIFEAFKDRWLHRKGWGDTKWLDYTIQFGVACIAEMWAMDWDSWSVIPAISINGALRMWFDPLINWIKGNGFWHLGENHWDEWMAELQQWQQLSVRILGSVIGILILVCWPVIRIIIYDANLG